MKDRLIIIILSILVPATVARAACMENAFIGTNVDENTYFGGFDLGTSSTYSPPDGNMIYEYSGACDGASGTSHVIIRVDSSPYDLDNMTSVSGLTQAGNQISGSYSVNGVINLGTFYTFVNNPSTGVNADTLQFKFVATNADSSQHFVALRMEIDTMVLYNDGTNVSVDNGISVITSNSIWYKSSGILPGDWWDYDKDPHTGTPTLVGRGHIKNNPFGEPATEPDIFEVAHWPDVQSDAQWTTAGTDTISTDSAVVYWWCNGDENSPGFQLNPGQSLTWIAYYGLNQGVLLTTPTNTPTITCTATNPPSPTITSTSTVTATNTPHYSPTITLTVTKTCTGTITPTRTITLSSTITMTCTITPTFTATPPMFILINRGVFPNPSSSGSNLVYWLSKDADVKIRIFSVSGELVAEKNLGHVDKQYNSYYWDGLNRSGKGAASGTYIFEIIAVDDMSKRAAALAKLAIVR